MCLNEAFFHAFTPVVLARGFPVCPTVFVFPQDNKYLMWHVFHYVLYLVSVRDVPFITPLLVNLQHGGGNESFSWFPPLMMKHGRQL